MRATFHGSFTGRATHWGAVWWLLMGVCLQPWGWAAPNEFGHPVFRDFPPGRARINHLCQAVAQDAAGYVYLGNGSVLRVYDGDAWRTIGLPTEAAGIRKFAVTAGGTMYAGGAGVMGWIREANGLWEFVSLTDQLPPADRGFEDIFDVLAVGETVYFTTAEKILIWRDGRFSSVPCSTPAHTRGARLHRVGDTVYVTALNHALYGLVDGRLEVIADDSTLRQNEIISIESGPGGELVLLTAELGFLQIAGGRVTARPTEANRWLAGKRIICALRLPDGSRAVAFASVSGDGGMRFGPDGSYAGPLDQTIGLFVNTIRAFLFDHEGGLWLGTETGLIRLEWPSAVTVFDAVNGLGQGAVTDVLRHDGVLYATTSEGVYRLMPGDGTGRVARFERMAGFPAYAPASHPAGLFNAGNEHRPDRAGPVQRLPGLVLAVVGKVTALCEEGTGAGGVLWVGGEKGLVRLEVARAFPPPVPFATLLYTPDVREGDQLPPGSATLRFDYVALRHQLAAAVTYQTRLGGFARDGSVWWAARTRVFTTLPPGDYRFEVRARDADGRLSAPASLGFAVRAAWWLTGWAWFAYAAAGAGVVAALVWYRTRALLRRAGRLETIIAARTAELARQNTELIRLNQLELDEKISARLAEEKARLEMLRYQLNPHFLYNTLASISAALPAGRSTARTMVERLADFCRLTLHRAGDRDWTSLGEEIQLLRTYLEIEQSRWGDLLDVAIDCDDALTGEQLPHFLLLPLVENALKYGRATSAERVGLRVGARREADGALVLEVANTGEWIAPAAKKTVSSLGIGLDNLRERLARYYPRSHRLDIAQAGGWVTVTLRILPPRIG